MDLYTPDTLVTKIALKRPTATFEASLCFSRASLETLQACQEKFLHAKELDYFQALSVDRRKRSYLCGRYCAKIALASYFNRSDLASFCITPGVFAFPVVANTSANVQVSIAHSEPWGAAIAFPEAHPMAIDVEQIDPERCLAIRTQTTPEEVSLIRRLPHSEALRYTLVWTVKEALSKVLKTGLMTPFPIYEINAIELSPHIVISAFKHFAQYKALSFCFHETVCSIVLPQRTEIELDIQALTRRLEGIEAHVSNIP